MSRVARYHLLIWFVPPVLLSIGAVCGCSDSIKVTPRSAKDDQTALTQPRSTSAAIAPPDIQVSTQALPKSAIMQIRPPVLSNPRFIDSLAAARNGKVLACGNHWARLWDTRTQALLWQKRVPRDTIECALSANGNLVALATFFPTDGVRISVYDVTKQHARFQIAHSKIWPPKLAFSPDGQHLLVNADRLGILNTQSGSYESSVGTAATHAQFGPDNTIIAFAGDKVIRWVPGNKNITTVAHLPGKARAVAFNRDGSKVAWTTGQVVGMLDPVSRRVEQLAIKQATEIKTLALSPKGDLLAIGLLGTGLSVWDLTTTTELWSIRRNPKRKKGVAPDITFSQDGTSLFVSTLTNIAIADARNGMKGLNEPRVRFHSWGADSSVIVEKNEKRWAVDLTTGEERGAAKMYPLPTNLPRWADEYFHTSNGEVVAYSDEDASTCGALRVWKPAGGKQTLPPAKGCDKEFQFVDVAWHVHSGIAIAVNATAPEVWDYLKRKRLFTIQNQDRPIVASAVSTNRQVLLLASGAKDDPTGENHDNERQGTLLQTWSIASATLTSKKTTPKEGVSSVTLSHDGRRAVVGWNDGTIEIHDTNELAVVHALGSHRSGIAMIQLSPDGKLLAASDKDHSTIIWKFW